MYYSRNGSLSLSMLSSLSSNGWSNSLWKIVKLFAGWSVGDDAEAWTEATFVSIGGDKQGSVGPLILCVQRTWARWLSH